MAGIDNDVNFALGFRLQATTSQQYTLMQQDSTDVGFINNAGSPEGVVTANVGSLCLDRTNGQGYVKSTGLGDTGWSMLALGGGSVSSVSGTANRITSTGGSTPVIDIDAAYVGQTSLTTLGTIATGTWNATTIGPTYGGTGLFTYSTGDIIYASGSNTLSVLPASLDGKVLTLASGIPSWATPSAGTVTSVSGTTNRITSTGGSTPVIDIDAAYVGQSSITTLGTIATGTWNATKISEVYGGTNQSTYATGDILYASAANTLSKLVAGLDGKVLTLSGGIPSWQTAAAGTVTSVSGTLNRVTSTGGSTPVIDIDAAYVGQTSITTLGTIATGTWSATIIGLTKGGTNSNLTASNGGVVYSDASSLQILAATATANKMLMSGASSAPTWSIPTFPNASASSGKFIRSDGTNWIASTPTLPTSAGTSGKVLQSDGTNYVESTPTYPSASGTSRKILVSDGTNNVYSTETWATPSTSGNVLTSDGTNWTSAAPAFSFAPNAVIYIKDDFIVLATPTSSAVYSELCWLTNGTWIPITQNSGTNPGAIGNPSLTSANMYLETKVASGSLAPGSGVMKLNWVVYVATLSTGTNTYTLRCGLGSGGGGGADLYDGAYFSYTNGTNSGKWVIECANTNAHTSTNTSTTVSAGAWVNLGVTINAGATSAEFFVNGSSVGTINTNVPNGRATGPYLEVAWSAGTIAASSVLVDLFYMSNTLTTPR